MAAQGNRGTCRLWICLVLAAILSALTPAYAQDAVPSPRTIGVFGDSLADGLWIGLRREMRGDAHIGEILQLSEVSTGLANYVYRDVAEKTREQLAETRIDIAVVMFGSNDMQGIRDGTVVHRFRSRGWEEVYRRRVRELIGMLQTHGAQVYWVGLPVMRSNGYDANTVYLNAIFEQETAAAGAVFIPTRQASADAAGGYSAYLPDAAGTPRLMRADDGIHFTMPGYLRIAAPVTEAIRTGWDDPRPLMAAAGPAVLPPPAPTVLDGLLDLTLNGQAYVCRAVDPAQPVAARAGSTSGAQP